MPWFKVDDELHGHPKPRRAGLAAYGLWTVSGAYSMAYKTDGFVPEWYVRSWPQGAKLAASLVQVGAWSADQKEGESGWSFHDWADYQPLSDEIEADRENARRRQRERRQRLRDSQSDHTPNPPSVTRDNERDEPRDSQDPVPSRPVPVVLRTTNTGDEDGESDRFGEFWAAYPRRAGANPRKPAQAKWAKLTKTTDPEVIIQGARSYAAQVAGADPKFTAQAITWLNQERWNDDYSTPPDAEGEPALILNEHMPDLGEPTW